MLFIFSNNQSLDLYSEDYVHPDFKPETFDFNVPHTLNEWQCYFFATNPDCKVADKIDNPIARTNLHSGAYCEYLKKKLDKGLVIKNVP